MRALHSAERKDNLAPFSGKKPGRRVISLLLCLCMTIPMLFSLSDGFSMRANAAGTERKPTEGVSRQADPSTMDTYQSQLDFSDTTRFAGRLWSDKTVFAYDYGSGDRSGLWSGRVLTLNEVLDGVKNEPKIELTDDFLHVYSVLGSSLQLNEGYTAPIDLAIIIDMSGSMGQLVDGNNRLTNSRIGKTVAAVNEAVDYLMKQNKESRVTVVAYGGSAYTLLPLGHYRDTNNNNKYIDLRDVTTYTGSTSFSSNTSSAAYTLFTTATRTDGGSEQRVNRSVRNNYTLNAGKGSNPSLNSVDAWIGYHTDMTAGIYLGFQELYKTTDVTVNVTAELTGEQKTLPRIPVAFVMTDGGTNVALKDPDTAASTVDGDEWYDMSWIPDNPQCQDYYEGSYTGGSATKSNYTQNPTWLLFQNETDSDPDPKGHERYEQNDMESDGVAGGPGVLFHTLMSAAYMTAKVQKHYTELWTAAKVENVDALDFVVDTIGVDLNNVTHKWEQPRVYASMDPRKYFNDNPPAAPNGAAKNDWFVSQIQDAYQYLQNWKSSDSALAVQVGEQVNGGSECDVIKFNKLTGDEEGGVTNEDVINNINYSDGFRNIEAGDLTAVFQELIDSIELPMFTPVGGVNDLGVDNAITYVDPIGKYMDVKDVKNLVLFGEMYDIVKTAVYDYQWNDKYITAMHKEDLSYVPGSSPLPEGWYKGELVEGKTVEECIEFVPKDGGLPEGYGSVADVWADGWVFRLNYQTAAQFVPTLSNIYSPGDMLAKERNTEYTFYRIDDTETVRTTLHMNPAYGTDADIPSDVKYNSNQSHLGTPGVYALADLRIWVEDTGDYSDESVGTLTDTNYDEALWVNIPVNMLPLRVVTINENADGTFNYTTNLDPTSTGYAASFPLRVFYTVGISDEVLDDTGRIKIAGALSAEYIEENKAKNTTAATARNVKQGEIEFFSNWYNPLNRYGDYVTTNTDYSYGDPVTSFSPDTSNRYYIFEKALPLYNTAYRYDGENWKRVVIGEDLTGDPGDTEKIEPSVFGGRLIAQDLNPEDTQGTVTERQDAIWDALSKEKGITKAQVQPGDIILLVKHRLTDVTKKDPDPFSSDAYFFLPIEYYELSKTGNVATKTQYVITRKGSEFGSAYKAAGITNGDMLCWHDVSGKYKQDYPYLSYTETSDPSRGKDYIGYPLDSKTGYYEGCDKSQHQHPDLATKPTGWEDMSSGTWVVCAKPGGLRVGNLAQNVQSKGGSYSTEDESKQINQYIEERYHNDPAATGLNWGYYANNVTRTANNYYVPTISTTSNIEESDVKVNVYLGNNGRLTVMDTTLLVSKLVELPEGITTPNANEEFNFQLYIDGATGTQNAVVVQWMPDVQSWQRQFHYVDLELDSQLFLQSSDGMKAIVDKYGCRLVADPSGGYKYAEDCTSGGQDHKAGEDYNYDTAGETGDDIYYVFIGRNRSNTELGVADTAFRVYHNQSVDNVSGVEGVDVTVKSDSGQGSTGTFYATKVWLVSDTTYNEKWVTGASSLNPAEDGFDVTQHDGKLLQSKNEEGKLVATPFELLTINPSVSDETTELAIQSPYRTLSSYWTKEVTFGVNANNDGSGNAEGKLTKDDLYDPIIPSADRPDYFSGKDNDYIAQHTAEFTLKHGQALLFSGIPSGSVYRVTEKLTKAQIDKGYVLKKVSHKQQVGSLSTYRPGAQSLPVYTKAGATYGEYGGGTYPQQYEHDKTEKGLFWALKNDGTPIEETDIKDYVKSDEPFFHTNAMVWEAYSTMDAKAPGDNHHQPSSENVANGRSIFWHWNETTQTSERFEDRDDQSGYLSHDVLDNPSCKSLELGGCDEDRHDGTVRHYFFKDGEMRDFHYEGEGSGFIRNIGRFITSPTVHFGVVGDSPTAKVDNPTQYTGVYSVFGNTGTFEESANFVNTVSPDLLVITKQMVDMGGNIVDTTPETEFEFTISLTQPGEDLANELTALSDPGPSVLAQTLYIWKGDKGLKTSGLTWSDGTHKMPDVAPNQTEYQKYILPADATEQVGLEPLRLTKSEADGKYTFKVTLKANQAIVLYGLAAGTDYTITETKLNKYPAVDPGNLDDVSDAGLVRTGTIQHNIATYLEMTPSTTPNRADFYNQMFNGMLTVQKKIEPTENVGDDITTKEFDFTVTLTPADGDLVGTDLTVKKYNAENGEVSGFSVKWENVTGEGGNSTGAIYATFQLKHGEKVEITGIPRKTDYTVKETQRDGYNLQHVAGNEDDRPGEGNTYLTVTNDSVSGTITATESQAFLLFVNGKAVAPPFTGGVGGANEMMFGGALLIGLSIVLFLFGKRKKRRIV